MESENKRIGLYISGPLLNQCDASISKTNASSRSEFIGQAVEHYLAWLNCQDNSRVLTPALESVIEAKVGLAEDRISSLLFKLAVEMAVMMNLYAGTTEVDVRTVETMRSRCIDEVRRINGRINMEDAVRYQNRRR